MVLKYTLTINNCSRIYIRNAIASKNGNCNLRLGFSIAISFELAIELFSGKFGGLYGGEGFNHENSYMIVLTDMLHFELFELYNIRKENG